MVDVTLSGERLETMVESVSPFLTVTVSPSGAIREGNCSDNCVEPESSAWGAGAAPGVGGAREATSG